MPSHNWSQQPLCLHRPPLFPVQPRQQTTGRHKLRRRCNHSRGQINRAFLVAHAQMSAGKQEFGEQSATLPVQPLQNFNRFGIPLFAETNETDEIPSAAHVQRMLCNHFCVFRSTGEVILRQTCHPAPDAFYPDEEPISNRLGVGSLGLGIFRLLIVNIAEQLPRKRAQAVDFRNRLKDLFRLGRLLLRG